MKLQLSFAGLTYPVSNLRKKVHPLPLWRRGFWLIRDHFAFNHPFVTSRSSMNPFPYWSSSSGFFDKWTTRVRRTLANKVIAQGVSSFMEENSGHVSICCLCKKKFYNFLLQYNQIMVVGSHHFANHWFYISKSNWHNLSRKNILYYIRSSEMNCFSWGNTAKLMTGKYHYICLTSNVENMKVS